MERTDPLLRLIEQKLAEQLDPKNFETWVADALSYRFPDLVPIAGGNDAGMDGVGQVDGLPFVLVVTTSDRVTTNLRKNLSSLLKAGGRIRAVVLATSSKLSARRKLTLSNIANELGFRLDVQNIFDREDLAWLFYRNPTARRGALGIDEATPPLGLRSPRVRLQVTAELVGREQDLAHLERITSDLVIVGKAGIGKTSVLECLVEREWGLFDTGAPFSRLVESIEELQPKRVIVDDAHLAPGRLGELLQARRETSHRFDIVATCWPGAEGSTRYELAGAPSFEIGELTRDQIVQVVEGVGVTGPRALIRLIVEQSLGRPSLATLLSLVAARGQLEDIATGDALLQETVGFYERAVGSEAFATMAVFALAGDYGFTIEQAARALERPVLDLWESVRGLASGGCLSEPTRNHGDERRLCVQPAMMRFPLLKRAFDDDGAPLLHVLAALDYPRSAIVPLCGAIHRGAVRFLDITYQLLERSGTNDDAGAVASIGPRPAQMALEIAPASRRTIAQASLRHSPGFAARILMELAVGDNRELHSSTDHPMRILGDFLSGPDSSMDVRREVAVAAVAWLEHGNDRNVGLQAFCAAVDPQFRSVESDPGAGHTITIEERPRVGPELTQMGELWSLIYPRLEDPEIRDFRPLQTVLNHWVYPSTFGPSRLPDWVYKEYEVAAREIVRLLAAAVTARPGIHSRLRFFDHSAKLGLGIEPDETFSALFPDERLERLDAEDWSYETWLARCGEAADQLAERWAGATVGEVVDWLDFAEREARTVGGLWPRFTPAVADRLAESRPDESARFLDAGLEAELPGDLLVPFLRTIDNRTSSPSLELRRYFRRALSSPSADFAALEFAFKRGLDDEITDAALNAIGARHANLLDVLVARDQLSDSSLVRLLQHPDESVRRSLASALAMSPGRLRSDDVEASWREVFLALPADDYHVYTRLQNDRNLLLAWVEKWLSQETSDGERKIRSRWLPTQVLDAVSSLGYEERTRILTRLGDSARSGYEAEGLVASLVNESPGLLELLFTTPSLHRHQAGGLRIAPSADWRRRIRMAVQHGWTVANAVAESTHRFISFRGAETEYWRQSLQVIDSLPVEDDLDREIKESGHQHFGARLARAEEDERHESVFGWDS